MGIPLYLAMTAADFRQHSSPAQPIAWLSCLFSPYGAGISNLPKQLPRNSLLILSDRTPPCGHDPELIKHQLWQTMEHFNCCGLLLDFERPQEYEALSIARELLTLPCPVALSAAYATGLDCPVFLPPIPCNVLPETYLSHWAGQEIWLEAAADAANIEVTENGSVCRSSSLSQNPKFYDAELLCHYDITVTDTVQFSLCRTQDDIQALLAHVESFGVTKAIGLYQELG